MTSNRWPPPILGMSVEEMARQIEYARHYLEALNEHLVVECQRLGIEPSVEKILRGERDAPARAIALD